MKLSRNVSALAVALVVNVLLVILLTPLGFETRPSADLKTVGYIAIGTIFAGLILDVASFALLFRRVRLASRLAIVGSILLFFPIFGGQTGSFFSLPIPPVVHTLEYIFIPVLLVTLFLASTVYRDTRPSPSWRILGRPPRRPTRSTSCVSSTPRSGSGSDSRRRL